MTDWKKTEDGVSWQDDLSSIELWDGSGEGSPIKASGFIDSWFDGESECPIPVLTDGVDFYAYTYWRICDPRLSAEGSYYICDQCGKNCPEWRPISEYKRGHDPQKIIAWARIRLWMRQPSLDLPRPEPYWTEWKDWTMVWATGPRFLLGTNPDHMDVLEYEITHWMPRLPQPNDFDPTIYERGNPN